jgi:hypothetical protein
MPMPKLISWLRKRRRNRETKSKDRKHIRPEHQQTSQKSQFQLKRLLIDRYSTRRNQYKRSEQRWRCLMSPSL